MSQKDYRMEFIKAVEQAVVPLSPDQQEYMIDAVTKILGNYEITERCTELATIDTTNERLRKRYCACLMVDGKSEKTIYQYRRALIRLDDFLHKPYTEIGLYDIRYYLACEKERGVSNRSVENMRSNLSAFFQWMTIEEIIPKNPLISLKPVKYKDEIKKAFSEVEIDALRGACRTLKERALIEFLLSSGVRVSELSSMDISDVNLEKMSVHVRNGKGGKERTTYITSVCAMHLKKYLLARTEDNDVLFYNCQHQRINPGGIRHILNTIAKRADVENVHPHRFRRTFATGLANRGMDIQEIQRLLGHSNINTTLEYVCIDDEKVKSSYRKYIA